MVPGVNMNMGVRERIRHFRRFIRRSRMDTIQLLLPVPLPGTALTHRLAADNRIFPRTEIGWEYYDGNFPLFVPDAPLTPEDMQLAMRKIMGRFYRFSRMFSIGLNILVFPSMLFSLWNVRLGWRRWYRGWRNDLIGFGGWTIFRRWVSNYRRGGFAGKLERARRARGA
jgi:hypothetical protein